MNFTYKRTIRFADTDAAGVVFFANYLAICHEAYEEALLRSDIELGCFTRDEEVILPISRASVDFLRPLRCGEKVEVELAPSILADDAFFVNYHVYTLAPSRELAANARTDHICLNAATRRRTPLPRRLSIWLRT